MVCIDSTGSMKTIRDASECTPIITGGTKLPFYNLDVQDFGGELVWTTSSLLGTWLDFPGQRTYVIQFPPGLAGHVPLALPLASVSSDNTTDMAPDASHLNATLGSGQLAEITNVSATQLSILNDTCVDYGLFIRVDAIASPMGTATLPSDAAVAE
jgi:hypothetical protein